MFKHLGLCKSFSLKPEKSFLLSLSGIAGIYSVQCSWLHPAIVWARHLNWGVVLVNFTAFSHGAPFIHNFKGFEIFLLKIIRLKMVLIHVFWLVIYR